jgi:hypothetical protein
MEVVGIVDVAPPRSVRALAEGGTCYDLCLVDPTRKLESDGVGIPVSGYSEQDNA